MPIDHKPPPANPPYSSESHFIPADRHSGKKSETTFRHPPYYSQRSERQAKKTQLMARNIIPASTPPSVNVKAVAKANYIQQLRKTSMLQTQASLVKHIPALKRLDNPASIPANLGFTIAYNDKGTLISVVPPDERLKANPQKYNEIKNKLINKLEQVENQFKGTRKQALFDEADSAEEQLLTRKEILLQTGASTPVVDYREFMVPLGSMLAPRSGSQPSHSTVHPGRASTHPDGEFMLEQERYRRKQSTPANIPRTSGFKLDKSDTDRVRQISTEEMALLNHHSDSSRRFLRQAYLGFRPADTTWLSMTSMKIQPAEPTDFERVAYSNSGHQVLKKYRVQLKPRLDENYVPDDEVLVVKDMSTNQLKLVRAGSFDGEDIGGGGFPGYSREGAERAFTYLKNKVVGNTRPYQHLQAGSGGNIEAWACGFNSLQVALFMATGVKVPFPVLVAAIEDQIDTQGPIEAQRIRKALLRRRYGFNPIIMQSLLGDTKRYESAPFGAVYNGSVLIGTEAGSPTGRRGWHSLQSPGYKSPYTKRY